MSDIACLMSEMEGRPPCRPVRRSPVGQRARARFDGPRQSAALNVDRGTLPLLTRVCETCEIAGRADVGGVLVTPRLLTCKELRGERPTYTHSGKRNCRVFTQSREERELTLN